MSRPTDQAYLSEVLQAWQSAFAEAEGDNMPQLYAASARRGRENDWTQLRPLLLVLRTTLQIGGTMVSQIAGGLEVSAERAADGQTVTDLRDTGTRLFEARAALQHVLDATNPQPGRRDGPGAGKPRKPVPIADPTQGGVAGLLDVGRIAVGVALASAGLGATTAVQAARLWWRGTTDDDARPGRPS